MRAGTRKKTKGILALFILAALYGGIGIVTRNLSVSFTLLQQNYLRCLLAIFLALFFFGKSLDFGKIKKITRQEWILLTARSAATFLIANTLWIAGANLTKLGSVGFIDALPLTATMSLVFGLERVTKRKIVFLILSFLGVIILSMRDLSGITLLGTGELLVLVSGFFAAFRNFSRRWHSNLLNDQEITLIMFMIGFIVTLIPSLVIGEKLNMGVWNWGTSFYLLLGGLFLVLNIFLTNYGFANVGLVLGNTILNLEPVFSLILGFLFYGEMLTIRELFGGGLILLSVLKMDWD